MRRSGRNLAVLGLALALMALALVACAPEPEPTVVEPIQEDIEQQTDQTTQSVDEALNAAQAAVSDFVSAGDGLETRVNGLKIKSDLQEIQRKVTNAIEETGEKKVAALDELSAAFENLVYRVELAASQLPEGGELQTELNDFAAQLKATQAELAAAAASYEPSGTATP